MITVEPALASNVGSLVMSLVSGFICLKFWRTSHKKEIYTIGILSRFFGFFALFQLFLGSRALFPALSEIQLAGIGVFAHTFLYISLAYFSRIAMYIHKPEWKDYVSGAIMLFGAVSMYLMIGQWTQIVPLIAIPSLIVWVGLGTAVFYNMAREREGLKRKKMLLLGTGFLIVALAGPLHGAAQTGLQLAVVEISTLVGIMAIALGVYWKELISSK